jgi:hypothetical protein
MRWNKWWVNACADTRVIAEAHFLSHSRRGALNCFEAIPPGAYAAFKRMGGDFCSRDPRFTGHFWGSFAAFHATSLMACAITLSLDQDRLAPANGPRGPRQGPLRHVAISQSGRYPKRQRVIGRLSETEITDLSRRVSLEKGQIWPRHCRWADARGLPFGQGEVRPASFSSNQFQA